MRIITVLLSVTLLSLAACGGKKKKEAAQQKQAGAKPQAIKVDGYIVTPQPFQENIEVPGNIVANEMAEIHPEVSGRIVQWPLLKKQKKDRHSY